MTTENTNLDPSASVNGAYKSVEVLPSNAARVLPGDTAKLLAPVPVAGTLPARDWAGVAHRVMDGAGSAWRILWKFVKLGICIGLDIFDFTFGRILGFGIAVDVGSTLIAMALWGIGWRNLWSVPELFDLTEQIDGFLPSCTLIALAAWNN